MLRFAAGAHLRGMEIAEVERGSVIVRTVLGDVEAFEALVAAYHDDVLRVCRLMCRHQQDAEDAAQETWTHVWRKLGALRDTSKAKQWIAAIAANESRQLLRRRRLRSLITWHRPELEPDVAPDLLDLRDAFVKLPVNDQRLLALRHAAGLTSVEIAETLGSSPGAVRVRLSRLHVKLRSELSHE